MKRLLYILLCLPLWLACTDEHIPASKHEVVEGERVELRMSVAIQGMNVASRAFADYIQTDAPSLWVVVFDQDGYLVEWEKAKAITDDGNPVYEPSHETEFSIELGATSEPRILHFIANYSDELELEYGHESNVIGSLVVDDNRDVYWHRKVLSEGINATDDYIAANFRRIPLLRNFAKITVGVADGVKFNLTGFYVLNVPTSGTVAPYSNGNFVNYAFDYDSKLTKTYSELKEEDYFGTMPNGVEYGQDGSSISWETGSFYMYENTYREVAEETTSILIKGKFNNSNTETYYRADLSSTELSTGFTEYYHILRNFEYHLTITNVVADGKQSPEAAIKAPANNNLSGSVVVKNLSNISNGTAKLEVSYTDMVLVSTDPVTLKYRFLPKVSETTTANDRIQIYPTVDGAKAGSPVAINGNVISSYTVASSNETVTVNNTSTDTGWRVITITPVSSLPQYAQEQTIRLYDTQTKLYRDVKYTLRNKLDMTVNCTPIVPATAGSPVVVNICIPNGLNENLFPLEFAIESNTSATSTTLKQYISPNSEEVMSVSTGTSIVPGHTSDKSYQYIKELTYEEYLQLVVFDEKRVFPVNFVTNTAASASTVYVSNKYFNQGRDNFINGTAHITSSSFTGNYYGLQQPAGLTINGSGTASVTTNLNPENQNITWNSGTFTKNDYQTTTWSDRSMGVVTVTENGNSYEYYLSAGPVRNILKMIVTSAKLDETDLEAATTMRVYRDAQSAKEFAETQIMTEVLSSFAAVKNKTYEVDNLKADDKFWFAYMDAEGYIYYTSAEAKDLVAGAELKFKSENRTVVPVEMSIRFDGDTQTYGTEKLVNAVFTTNKAGEYQLSSTNSSLKFNSITVTEGASLSDGVLTIEEAAVGQEITIECETLTPAEAASVTVTYETEDEQETVTATAEARTAPTLNSATLGATSAYYGEGHDVILTINVSAPCTVNITLIQGLTYNNSTKITNYSCTAGDNTITLKSAGWNIQEKATVTLTVDGTPTTKEAIGAERNQLVIPAGKLMARKESGGRNSDISIYTDSGYQTSVATFSGNSNSSQLIIYATGLTENSTLYFSYTHTPYSFLPWEPTTETEYGANTTIGNILDSDGATLSFSAVQ